MLIQARLTRYWYITKSNKWECKQELLRHCKKFCRQVSRQIDQKASITSDKVLALSRNAVFQTTASFGIFGLPVFRSQEQKQTESLRNDFIRKQTIDESHDALISKDISRLNSDYSNIFDFSISNNAQRLSKTEVLKSNDFWWVERGRPRQWNGSVCGNKGQNHEKNWNQGQPLSFSAYHKSNAVKKTWFLP